LPPSPQKSRKRKVTIKDVAQAAGVSVTTVSNALNNRSEAMTGETLQRIQEAIRTLNYRPSSVARSMVTKRTATIGLIIAEIETALFLQSLNIIEPIARASKYNVLVCSAHNLEEEQQAVNLLLEKQVDGIIFISQSRYMDDDYLDYLPLFLPPIVLINRSTRRDRFDNIRWDNTGGFIAAMDHLVQLGHRNIAALHGPTSRRSSDERFEGYKLGLKKYNLDFREDYVQMGDFESDPPEAWEQATQSLISVTPRPTAILASNDTVAAVVMRTVQQAGLRLPEDITVVGNDNKHFCIYLNPTLTTVELPILEAGQRAIEILLSRISGNRNDPESIILPCPLVIRESSGPI